MHLETTHLFPDKPVIGKNSELKDTRFGAYVELGEQNRVDNSYIGDYTYTGQYCFIQNSEIGKFCSIASMVRIGPTDHPYERPSQHLFAYNGAGYGFPNSDHAFLQKRRLKKTIIGHDVWIGHGVIIQSGVEIGAGAVIASGAVVTKNVDPYTIVGGVPAKPLKLRFEKEIQQKLLDIAWWDWSREQLEEQYEDFKLPITDFVNKWS